MFPPKKQSGPPAPKKPGGPPPGPGGPPPGADPFGGGADPFGPAPAGALAGPPGMDPFGGAAMPPMGPPPGMPRPGQGMDPMQAMLGGIGPMGGPPPPPPGPPMGPDGMPVGGSLPPMGPDDGGQDMGGSGLLQALQGALSGGGDPYAVTPFQPGQGFEGMGQGDPNMGVEQMLQLLALGQMGVGGGPGAGSSGVDVGPFGNMGQMAGY